MGYIGVMWYDTTKKLSIVDIITDAAERYFEKFNKLPELVLVNEAVLPELTEDLGIPVLGRKNISNRHLVWVGGMEE